MALNGNKIFIALGSGTTPIAATKSNEVQTLCETIEKSSTTSRIWKEFLTGRKEWSFSVDWLLLYNSDVQNLLNIGSSYTVKICSRGTYSNTAQLTGTAICTQCTIRATRGNLCQGKFTFKGTGALTT